VERKYKLHSGYLEVAVAKLIGYRDNTIVPNVSWGLGFNHECDMLILDKQGRFTEVEIKISASDLKADFSKKHGHKSQIISRLVYAMPTALCEKHSDLIPKSAGIIAVDEKFAHESYTFPMHTAWWFRPCKHDKTKRKPSEAEVKKFMHLGCMRIWSLKTKNNYG
jgi:hypothetical protein